MADLKEQYKSLFSSPGGEDVLADICRRGKLFEYCDTEEDRIRENFAKEILNMAKADDNGFIHKWNFWDLFQKIKKLTRKKQRRH